MPATELGVARAIDLAHAADTQPRDDLVRPEALTERQPAQAAERAGTFHRWMLEELLCGRRVPCGVERRDILVQVYIIRLKTLAQLHKLSRLFGFDE